MTVLSLVNLYFPLMIGSCILGMFGLYKISNFLSAFITLSFADVSVLSYFVWYLNSYYFNISFVLTLSTSSVIMCTGSLYSDLSSGSDVGVLHFSIRGTKFSSCASRKIFIISTVSIIFHFSHLISLVIMKLLV